MAEACEAERFFESLRGALDTSSPLRWGFLLSGVTEHRVEPLMEAVLQLSFTEVEPLFDEEREGHYTLWFAEVRVHTGQSFAERVAMVEQLAMREGLVVADFSAGHPE